MKYPLESHVWFHLSGHVRLLTALNTCTRVPCFGTGRFMQGSESTIWGLCFPSLSLHCHINLHSSWAKDSISNYKGTAWLHWQICINDRQKETSAVNVWQISILQLFKPIVWKYSTSIKETQWLVASQLKNIKAKEENIFSYFEGLYFEVFYQL
jgi:hypothetical protein